MSLPAAFRDRLRLPVIASPMFIASTPELVIEQCKAGIIGSFPALNARPAAALDDWLARIGRELDEHAAANPHAKVAPFAVHDLARRTPRTAMAASCSTT
jgi:nitronate monooxygenase